ncbi:MAG: class I SAM-dependent methyltransferase [Spirillospora sp.]
MSTASAPGGDVRSTELPARYEFVLGRLPDRPARVVEIGCGDGDLARAMARAGHDVTAVDPQAPQDAAPMAGLEFRRCAFEDAELTGSAFDVAVASLSLHHVDDLGHVLDKMAGLLRDGGTVLVAEFGWDLIDEASARWYSAHLPAPPYPPEAFLAAHGDRWRRDAAAGRRRPLAEYVAEWAADERMHPSSTLLRELRSRFGQRHLAWLPYLHGGLTATEADEAAAIRAGRVRATGFHFVGAAKTR